MNRIVHFEIHADDPKRAIAFYEGVFGWKIEKWGNQDYWMVMTAEKDSVEKGISGGLLRRKGSAPASGQGVNAYVCTVLVDNLDEMSTKVETHGGKMSMPKFAIPGMAWQAYYIDTEDNIFGLHQSDVNAK